MNHKNKASIILSLAAVALLASACNKAEAPTDINYQSQNQAKAQSYTVAGVEGKTALDSLQAKHKVSIKQAAGLGQYVETIEDSTPDSNHYWAFYINGQPSTVGAGQYTAKKGDSFEFRLEEIKQ